MTEETGGPKPRARRTTRKTAEPMDKKVEKLADDAVEAGRKLMETETGRKVADAANEAFDKAEALAREAAEKAGEMGRKAMDSREAKEATETAKAIWNTPLGRNVGIGAGAGAALALVVPGVGLLVGALVGGGLGYLRTITKK
jgi:hypothetical protein